MSDLRIVDPLEIIDVMQEQITKLYGRVFDASARADKYEQALRETMDAINDYDTTDNQAVLKIATIVRRVLPLDKPGTPGENSANEGEKRSLTVDEQRLLVQALLKGSSPV